MPNLPVQMFRKQVCRLKYLVGLIIIIFLIVKIYRFVQLPAYPFEAGQENVNSLLTKEEYKKISHPFLSGGQCNQQSTTLVAINSATANLHRREAIRETWSNWVKKSNETLLFFLSMPDNPFLKKELELENYYYNDIVLLSVKESYYLLSFKTLSIMSWAKDNCPGIKFLVKCDDDMFVNWPKLNKYLTDNRNQTNAVIGEQNLNLSPNRDPYSRWYMPRELYALDRYPEYLDGPIYMVTMDLVPRLLNATSEVKALYLEDVYVTGLLRKHVGGQIVFLKEFITYQSYFEPTSCISFSSYSYHKIPANVQSELFTNYTSNSQNVSIICSFFTVFH